MVMTTSIDQFQNGSDHDQCSDCISYCLSTYQNLSSDKIKVASWNSSTVIHTQKLYINGRITAQSQYALFIAAVWSSHCRCSFSYHHLPHLESPPDETSSHDHHHHHMVQVWEGTRLLFNYNVMAQEKADSVLMRTCQPKDMTTTFYKSSRLSWK